MRNTGKPTRSAEDYENARYHGRTLHQEWDGAAQHCDGADGAD
jgi:hypothetical protein